MGSKRHVLADMYVNVSVVGTRLLIGCKRCAIQRPQLHALWHRKKIADLRIG